MGLVLHEVPGVIDVGKGHQCNINTKTTMAMAPNTTSTKSLPARFDAGRGAAAA